METGGAETALLGLLQALDYARVDVDLFVYAHQGPLMQHIPESVNLLPQIKDYSLIEQPIKNAVTKGRLNLVLTRIKAKAAHKKHLKQGTVPEGMDDNSIYGYVGKYVSPVLPDINLNKTYDLAISFLTPHNFCLEHVKARRKIAWVHTDYAKVYVNPAVEASVWLGFDKIVAVSDDVEKNFIKAFPDANGKTIVIENILPEQYIQKLAKVHVALPYPQNKPVLLSIGRFSYPKNFEGIPFVAREMVEKYGVDFQWFIMGYGAMENKIRDNIQRAGMEEYVTVVSQQTNPYPWIKSCDIYVQPSRYEGKSVCVREAQFLGKPVVITDYPTSSTQVKDGCDGIISPIKSLADAIVGLMQDKEKQQNIVDNLAKGDYVLREQTNVIYSLLP